MSYEVGYDTALKRDIGYGVPSECEHPDCTKSINRGMSYLCAECHLYFCWEHLLCFSELCQRCTDGKESYNPKPDTAEWIRHKLTHPSWEEWRKENEEVVRTLKLQLGK